MQGGAGITHHLIGIRSIPVMLIARTVDHRGIIDDRRSVDDGDIACFPHIIVADMRARNILMRHETPVVRGRVITAGDRQAGGRSKRRPSVVAVAVAPGDPGGRPFITGNPHPSVTVPEEPTAIVESGPSPGIAGIPGPSFVGIGPVTIRGVRLEIAARIGHPDISVLRILDPLAIRAQLVVKGLIRYVLGVSGWGFRGCGSRRRSRALDHINGSASGQGDSCCYTQE